MRTTFVKSSQFVSQCPQDGLPEYAFIGRSNVGKSSLINMLAGISKLSKVSGTPGKTRLINHFIVDDKWYIVDLPGYGFARISKSERIRLREMINNYIAKRTSLTLLFVLLDLRLQPQQIDLEFIDTLGERGVPFALIFTKCDKLSRIVQHANLSNYKRILSQSWDALPRIFVSSSEHKIGGDEILAYISQINSSLEQSNSKSLNPPSLEDDELNS
ncbi:MAG: ribosome biogenesis GTP-binding protein YihA/YsxC [Bacteroidales bacterium]